MLGVVEQAHVHTLLVEQVDQGVDGTGALRGALSVLTAHVQTDLQDGAALVLRVGGDGGDAVVAPPGGAIRGGQVLVREDLPQLLRRDLGTGRLRVLLHGTRELDLGAAGQVDPVLALEQVGHTALAGLRVHADHGLVAAPHVLGVDGQVRHRPLEVVHAHALLLGVALHGLEALLDGVLVRARERREHQVPAVRAALGDGQLVAVLHGAADLLDVREVDLRVNSLGQQVQTQGHQVHVAGALAVAEQAPLDPVRPGQVAQLRGGHTRAAVVVGVQGQDDVLPVVQVTAHPLDGVRVHVGGGHLHGGGQVDDHLPSVADLEGLGHLVADPGRELQLGAGVGLRGVLVHHVRAAELLLVLAAQAGPGQGDVHDPVHVLLEHHAPLQGGGGVVEVHDRVLGAVDGLVGAFDQVLPGLGQHLDRDVVRDVTALHQRAHEVEVGLGRGREAHLDLLEAHAHEQLEHLQLAVGVHGVDQGLVAVPQVHGAPARRRGGHLVRPRAVGHVEREVLLVRGVLVGGHAGGALQVLHGRGLSSCDVVAGTGRLRSGCSAVDRCVRPRCGT